MFLMQAGFCHRSMGSDCSPPKIYHRFVEREGIVTMKIGFVSLPASGHLNPMTALARKMQARGHEVVFIGVPELKPRFGPPI